VLPGIIEESDMTKNLMSLALSAEDLHVVDAALTTLESRLAGLISLRVETHYGMARMGEKSEVFCRQTLASLAQNPQIVPPGFDLAEAQADLAAADALHPRLLRLRRLTGRAEDSELALGCDVMVAALQGDALLKVAAGADGREGVRQVLLARFDRTQHPVELMVPCER
jgi:hypothetical protein